MSCIVETEVVLACSAALVHSTDVINDIAQRSALLHCTYIHSPMQLTYNRT
jgi:hypothetical protein